MPEEASKAWYTTWFGSPYYEILYKDHNRQEADIFMKNVVDFLQLAPHGFMLDVACGKGRHALSLNALGYRVTGFDLSEANIKAANKNRNDSLDFYVHDMRKPFMVNYYDVIFNLFTSFGYFEHDHENRAVLGHIYNALKPNGIFVLDFANMEKALHCLSSGNARNIGGVEFYLTKSINEQGFLVKQIFVKDGALQYNYEERIKVFTPQTLKTYITDCGFEILKIFGDYKLNDFDKTASDRLIILCKKS